MERFQYKKAQQLVEFLLVVPFMVIILGILTEYAYALNINMTLSEGIKTVNSLIYSQIKPGMTEEDVRILVKSNLIDYLKTNNAPTKTENNINVSYATIGQTTVFMSTYTYIPAFTLPNAYFKILPDKFDFVATAAVPTAFLSTNSAYNGGIDSETLDKIWSASDFSSLEKFNGSKKGVIKDSTATSGRSNMLFLVPNTTATSLLPGPSKNAYALVNWNGTILKSGADTYNVNTGDGKVYTCTSLACTDTGNKFLNYATTNGFSNIIFIHDSEANDLSDLSSWITPAGSTDISASTVDGILKRALCLVNSASLSIGNYDNLNLNVKDYNETASPGNAYTVETFGSMVFVHYISGDDISKITNGASVSDYDDERW